MVSGTRSIRDFAKEVLMTEKEKTPPALWIRDLSVEFRGRNSTVYALSGLNLKINKGETLGLVGETGAGKTTAGLSVLGLVASPPGVITGGSISVAGKEIIAPLTGDEAELVRKRWGEKKHRFDPGVKRCVSEEEMMEMRGRHVSMIFQDPMTSLNPVITVEKQISEVISKHTDVSGSEALRRAGDMLELVGIPRSRGKEYPHQFSGGMKQRVVIAMALALSPELLIADEPTTALDVTIQAQVLDMMKKLRDENRTSMLMITHDLGIVADICDRVSVIYAGRVVEHGTLSDVFDHTLHPYTKGLFASLPDLENRETRLKPIRGLMPDPSIRYTGCPFADRCDEASEVCRKEAPPVYHRTEDHMTVCHLYRDKADKKGM